MTRGEPRFPQAPSLILSFSTSNLSIFNLAKGGGLGGNIGSLSFVLMSYVKK